jgi:hypothetical protein
VLKRARARTVITDPMIQLFQELGNKYDPYTQGDAKYHIPAINTIELADLLAFGYPLSVDVSVIIASMV